MTDDDARQLAALRTVDQRGLDVLRFQRGGGPDTRWIVTDQRYVDGRPGRGMGPTLADAVDAFKPAEKARAGKRRKAVEELDEDGGE